MKTCKVKGCDLKHSSRGFCNIHYQRHIRGIPMEGNPKKTIKERIYEKTEKLDNGCLKWTGAKAGGDGREEYKYGYITINQKQKRVHRVLYEIHKKIKLKDKDVICHKCDYSLCVNIDHLFLGDTKANSDDKYKKGRANHARGEDNNSKLKEHEVIEMRRLYKTGKYNFSELSRKYDIHPTTARHIVKRKKWTHI